MVAERAEKTKGRISARRLPPEARATGYEGLPRNFRRLVAAAKADERGLAGKTRRAHLDSPRCA